jgi:hypothetical protein
MAICRLSTASRNAAAAAIAALADAGSGPGTIKIYTGAPPATPATAPSGTLLATVVMGDPAFTGTAGGTSTGADPAAVTPVASGTAGWFRMADSDGGTVYDGDVTATGGGGTLTLSSVALTTGAPVDITSIAHTMPTG